MTAFVIVALGIALWLIVSAVFGIVFGADQDFWDRD